MKKLLMEQRFRNHPRNKGRARKADKKVKTITGRLVRELDRKLAPGLHQDTIALFKKVLTQKKTDSNKIYSLHEPHTQCISKGKEHKKYEFGSSRLRRDYHDYKKYRRYNRRNQHRKKCT